jgi:putative transposase
VIDDAFGELVDAGVDVRRACKLVGRPRSTYYWRARPKPAVPAQRASRPTPANALSVPERDRVLALLRDPSFVDKSPAQVWARLLDDGIYLCSQSTMYRILRASGESRERRRQATHPAKVKPELVAHAPGEIYSWDITKLRGPLRGVWYDLYVMLDIFSRYAVGWMVADRESAELAKRLIAGTCRKQHIAPDQLTLRADRGTSMRSKPVAPLLADLGITKTHSRPHVSGDNPFSERPVQDPEVPARVPGTLRLYTGRTGLLPGLLPLVQHRTPSQRHRLAHPRGPALRPFGRIPNRRPRSGSTRLSLLSHGRRANRSNTDLCGQMSHCR